MFQDFCLKNLAFNEPWELSMALGISFDIGHWNDIGIAFLSLETF
jgi:hypothetical protein